MKKAPMKMKKMTGGKSKGPNARRSANSARSKKKLSEEGQKKAPMKKALVGNQKNLPEALKKEILAATKMKKAAMKLKKESGMMMKKAAVKMKKASAMKMKMKKK